MERWGKIGVRRPQVYQLNSLTSYRRKIWLLYYAFFEEHFAKKKVYSTQRRGKK